MTLEGVQERPDGPVVVFRKPEGNHRKLIWGMRGLMILAVISSLRNTWDLMMLLGEVWEAMDELKQVLFEDMDPDLALVRDYSVFLQAVVGFVLLMAAVVFLILIVRYTILWFQVPKGHPKTYDALRFWAILLIMAELLVALMWGFITLEQYEELRPARSLNLLALVGVLMLVLLALRPCKRFYSRFRIERASPDAAPRPGPVPEASWIPAPDVPHDQEMGSHDPGHGS